MQRKPAAANHRVLQPGIKLERKLHTGVAKLALRDCFAP